MGILLTSFHTSAPPSFPSVAYVAEECVIAPNHSFFMRRQLFGREKSGRNGVSQPFNHHQYSFVKETFQRYLFQLLRNAFRQARVAVPFQRFAVPPFN